MHIATSHPETRLSVSVLRPQRPTATVHAHTPARRRRARRLGARAEGAACPTHLEALRAAPGRWRRPLSAHRATRLAVRTQPPPSALPILRVCGSDLHKTRRSSFAESGRDCAVTARSRSRERGGLQGLRSALSLRCLLLAYCGPTARSRGIGACRSSPSPRCAPAV